MATEQKLGPSAISRRLRDHMRAEGLHQLTTAEALGFFQRYGLDESQARLGLAYGSNKQRRFWTIDGNTIALLEPARAQRTGAQQANRQLPPLEDVQNQLYTLALGQGLSEKTARATALYMATSDLDDINSVAEALQDMTELSPAMRRRLLRLWGRMQGIDVPPQILPASRSDPAAPGTPKTYFVDNQGNLIQLPSGEEGLTLGPALAQQQAVLERMRLQAQPQESPVTSDVQNQVGQLVSKLLSSAIDNMGKPNNSGPTITANVGGSPAVQLAVDDYIRLSESQQRAETLSWIKQTAPGLVGALKDFAAAAKRQADIADGSYRPPQPSRDLDAFHRQQLQAEIDANIRTCSSCATQLD